MPPRPRTLRRRSRSQPKSRRANDVGCFPRFGVGAFLLGVGVGAAGSEPESNQPTTAEPAPTVTVAGVVPQDELDAVAAREAELDQWEADLDAREAALTEQEQAIEAGTIPGDGVFLVGDEIAPGEYRTDSGDCYWARLSGTSGEFEDIIANGNGAGIVTIAESDHAFESRSCGEWTLVQ
jgi:hypothetical protein